MSSQPVIDYLTKQIFIERNIVTYRSLSRELRLHVNDAKNELAIYHENAPYHSQTCAATYLLCGDVVAPGDSEDADMDYDFGTDVERDYEDDGDEVPQTMVLLVNERDLEAAKLQFTRLDSIHIYSLAPSPITDAGLLCTPTERVRDADRGKQAKEMVQIVGKIISPNIQVVQPTMKGTKSTRQPVAGPSRLKPAANTTSTTIPKDKAIVVPEPPKAKNTAENPKGKPKPTGKLDFSKAKPKERKSEALAELTKEEDDSSTSAADFKAQKTKEKLEPPKRGTKRKSVLAMSDEEEDDASSAAASRAHSSTSASDFKAKKTKEKLEPPKRGTKRTSVLSMSDEEDDTSSAAASKAPSKRPSRSKENVRVQKRTVLSDEEDDAPQPARKPRKSHAAKAVDSDTENVQALMDIDDDQVVRVTRETHVPAQDEENDEEVGEQKTSAVDEDVDMLDDSVPKPKPKKREKKVVPVGRNGLKKKRVIMSRETVDAKGWIVTEDYSEYESVDENEEPEPASAKGKAKAKAKAKSSAKAKQDTDEDSPAPAPKLKLAAKGGAPKTSKSGASGAKGAQKQGKLANFFTSKPKN